jgi:dTDP-D-glucose 4,6-dehydratase
MLTLTCVIGRLHRQCSDFMERTLFLLCMRRNSHLTIGGTRTKYRFRYKCTAGTLNLLEATRQNSSDADFIFVSTNKVYGDAPNQLPLLLSPRYRRHSAHEKTNGQVVAAI